MKNLNLENFGVVEMDAKSMREIDGGDVIINPKHLRYKGSMAEATWNFLTDFFGGFTSDQVNVGYRQITGKNL